MTDRLSRPRRAHACRIAVTALLAGAGLLVSGPALAKARLDQIGEEILRLQKLSVSGIGVFLVPLYENTGNYWIGVELEELQDESRDLRVQINENEAGVDPLYGEVQPLGDPNNDVAVTALAGTGGAPIAVGYSATGSDNGDFHAIEWTLTGGTVDLGTIGANLSGVNDSEAYGLSDDGRVVVGSASAPGGGLFNAVAFRWTAADNTMRSLGSFKNTSIAYATSADGSVVVGQSEVPNPIDPDSVSTEEHAFRWVLTPHTTTGLMTDLDPTYTYPGGSAAYAVSADGKTVVGSAEVNGADGTVHALRWTPTDGTTLLPMLSGETAMIANAVDGDGQIVVGTAAPGEFTHREGDTDTVPFRWTAAKGTESLVTLLENAGVDLSHDKLVSATSITRDGQFIAGNEIIDGENDNDPMPYVARFCDDTNADACTTGGGGGTVGGMTTSASLAGSLGMIADEGNAVAAQLGGTAGLLLGELEPVIGDDHDNIFGSVGSFTLGANGRKSLDNGLTVLGGAAFVDQSAGGASVSGAALFGAAIRYVHSVPLGDTGLRPFAEGGVWGSPNLSMHFTRSYSNGSGTATGTGDASGSVFDVYARAGVLYAPTADDELAFSVTLARDWLNVGAYAEASGSSNPFPASFAAATSSSNEVEATAQWTRHISPDLDVTVSGSIGRSFGGTNAVTATIPGFGALTGTTGDYSFGQLGARLDYKVSDSLKLDVFATSTFGDRIGTHTQFGGGLNVSF